MNAEKHTQINIKLTQRMKDYFQAGADKVNQTLSAYIKSATYRETTKVLKQK